VSNANSVHISRVSINKKCPSHCDQYYYPNDIRCRMQTKKSLVMSSYPQSNLGDEHEPFVNVCLITCSTVTVTKENTRGGCVSKTSKQEHEVVSFLI